MAKQEWEHLQTFLEAATSGSFTQAARALGVSQPTVSRRIEELEGEIGAPLFIRHSRGLHLTDKGAALLESIEGLDHQVREVFRRIKRGGEQPEGAVRLSVNEPLAAYALGPALRRVSLEYPKIELEVVVENGAADLTRREADLAVRMFEPKQGELIATYVGQIEIGFFASPSYLAQRAGPPVEPTAHSPSEEHVFFGMDQDPGWGRLLERMGLTKESFRLRSDSLLLAIAAARAGAAIVGTHVQIGQREGLVPVDVGVSIPPYPVWLVRHEALRNDLAVRTVTRELERALKEYIER